MRYAEIQQQRNESVSPDSYMNQPYETLQPHEVSSRGKASFVKKMDLKPSLASQLRKQNSYEDTYDTQNNNEIEFHALSKRAAMVITEESLEKIETVNLSQRPKTNKQKRNFVFTPGAASPELGARGANQQTESNLSHAHYQNFFDLARKS